jgi:hypothetical protein
MKGENPTLDEYRTGYIAEKHNLPDNAARALQLFEVGFSVSGATKHLPVTESTVKSYHNRLMDTIDPNVVLDIHAKHTHDIRFDVWGDRHASEYEDVGYDEGVADAQESGAQATDRKAQIDPAFREREKPLNRGMAFDQIPSQLVTINGGDN